MATFLRLPLDCSPETLAQWTDLIATSVGDDGDDRQGLPGSAIAAVAAGDALPPGLVARVVVTTAGTEAFGTIPSCWATEERSLRQQPLEEHRYQHLVTGPRPITDPLRTERRPD